MRSPRTNVAVGRATASPRPRREVGWVAEPPRPREPVERGRDVRRTLVALRNSREAVQEVEEQLDDLLVQVRDPSRPLDRSAPDRLAASARKARHALAALAPADDMSRLF